MPGIKKTLHEFNAGTLHSGSKKGPVVKSRKQALAIALSENRAAKRKRRSLDSGGSSGPLIPKFRSSR